MRILLFFILLLLNKTIIAQSLFPFEKKTKWGYMNNKGKIIIEPKYDYASSFNQGFAVVALGNLPCLIDSSQKRYIDTGLYQYIGKYSNGLCAVLDYKFNRYYVNAKGIKTITLDKEIYDAGAFNSGLARVSKKVYDVEKKFGVDVNKLAYKYAYINTNGNYVTSFLYDDAEDIFEGIARVSVAKKFGLINDKGTEITAPTYQGISSFNEETATIEEDGKFGFINKQGIITIKPQYEFAMPYSEGLAGVLINNKWGFINKAGALSVPAIYDGIKPFGQGLAAVQQNNKWGFVDTNGALMMVPFYQNAGYFNEGLCPVQKKNKWGVINKEGRVIIPFDFEFIDNYENGIAEVIYLDINLYIDTNGNLLPRIEK